MITNRRRIRPTACRPQPRLADSSQPRFDLTTWLQLRAAVILGAALIFVGITSPAYSTPTVMPANNVHVISTGTSARGGWVAFTGIGTSTSTRQLRGYAVVPAGGGTWSFGAYLNSYGQKVCYSNYYHPTAAHGSSAVMNGATSRSDVGSGVTSFAQVARYTFDTCYAYWR